MRSARPGGIFRQNDRIKHGATDISYASDRPVLWKAVIPVFTSGEQKLRANTTCRESYILMIYAI